MLVRPYHRLLVSVWRWSWRAASYSSSTESGSLSSVATKEPQGKEVNVVVSSLRVDAVAAAGLDISRKCVGKIIFTI